MRLLVLHLFAQVGLEPLDDFADLRRLHRLDQELVRAAPETIQDLVRVGLRAQGHDLQVRVPLPDPLDHLQRQRPFVLHGQEDEIRRVPLDERRRHRQLLGLAYDLDLVRGQHVARGFHVVRAAVDHDGPEFERFFPG